MHKFALLFLGVAHLLVGSSLASAQGASVGTVAAWGYNSNGQCNPPVDLGECAAIAGGSSHTIALQQSGFVRAWGYNGNGQCTIPSDLGVCTQIAGGSYHTIALEQSGLVRAWGYNVQGQCTIPSDLGVCTHIAGGGNHTIAVQSSGFVRAWGYNSYGQCTVPTGVASAFSIAGGSQHTIALFNPLVLNTRSDSYFANLPTGILAALDGDTLIVQPSLLTSDDIDYRGKSIEVRSRSSVARGATSTTLFADGARMTAPAAISLDGTINVPTNAGITLASGTTLDIAGSTFVSLGGSVLAQNDGSIVTLSGSMVLVTNGVFNALAPVSLTGSIDILGGVLVAESFATTATSQFTAVNAVVDSDTLAFGGDTVALESTLVGDVSTASAAQLAASGELVGSLDNAGRTLTTDDFVVVGSVHNQAGGTILAQVGVLYITGDLVNNGVVVGNVILAPPGLTGGGTGGTHPGDGIRVAGSVTVGAAAEVQFVEALWKFSLCGDMSLACPAGNVMFNSSELSFDGCESDSQRFEVTSRDYGCVAAPFDGEESDVSLFGEISVRPGSTLELIDDFDNAAGKSGEVIYCRGLHVFAGATLITNGHTIYSMNANIEGSVDDASNICELPHAPDADINGDGQVNGIDLAYVLTYWGSGSAIADLNNDGVVSGPDLAIVLVAWGM